ncbi:MAG: cardiolipin synthase [Thermoplasmata archaeon]|nr:cardiolipin synthase [Thermoplasmata archaeon]
MVSDLIFVVIVTILVADVSTVLALIFAGRRDPQSVLAWALLILAFPVGGFVLYLLFGFKYFKSREFRQKSSWDRTLLGRVLKGEELGVRDETGQNLASLESQPDLARMLWSESSAFLTAGNQVKLYIDGREKFDALFEAIDNAKQHIHLEYYLIRNDSLGERLVQALERKAAEGVEIRLLYDDLGNGIPRARYRKLTESGGHVSGFYRAWFPTVGLRVNYRNHRKIAVIDGTVGFVGGFNIGNEYLGEGPLGAWRDSAVRIQGGAVRALQLRFALDWNFAFGEELPRGPRYFPSSPRGGSASIQVVSGGPDTPFNPPRELYVKMVSSAKRTCYLQTPYFVPDGSVLTALRLAALSGVDVRIMVPTKPDQPFVHWASLSYIGELLDAGVRAFSYDAGFLHAKTATVDDQITSVGSANWDIRSFNWNFETNAVIYDSKLSKRYREIFEDDMTRCTEITQAGYEARSRAIRFKESISRLFSAAM